MYALLKYVDGIGDEVIVTIFVSRSLSNLSYNRSTTETEMHTFTNNTAATAAIQLGAVIPTLTQLQQAAKSNLNLHRYYRLTVAMLAVNSIPKV